MNQSYTPAEQALHDAVRNFAVQALTAKFSLEGSHLLPQVRAKLQQAAEVVAWLADSTNGFDLKCLDFECTEALEDILDGLAALRLRTSEPQRIRQRAEPPPFFSGEKKEVPFDKSGIEGGTPGFGAARRACRAHSRDCRDFRLSSPGLEAGHKNLDGPEKSVGG